MDAAFRPRDPWVLRNRRRLSRPLSFAEGLSEEESSRFFRCVPLGVEPRRARRQGESTIKQAAEGSRRQASRKGSGAVLGGWIATPHTENLCRNGIGTMDLLAA
jgi:hypothetical protein